MKVRKTQKSVIRTVPMHVKPITAAVATAIGSFSGISLADTTSSASNAREEIVVTATRRDASVQDVPYNLSAISGQTIENLQLMDISDLARWTPGLVQVDQGPRDANRLIMRGLNASGMEAPEKLANGTGGRVSIYFDETPIYIDLKLIDIDRVEVLRGPQGTLYGTRSMGGSIRYMPKRPDTEEFSVDVHGRGYGMSESDDAGYDTDVVINVPLVQDTLALRAVLGYMKRPGFIDYNYLVNEAGVSCAEPGLVAPGECTADDLHSKSDVNDEQTASARVGLLWNISDNWEALLNLQYQNQEIGGRQMNTQESMAPIGAPPAFETGPYVSGMRFEEPKERENKIANVTVKYSGDPFDFVSSSSYTDYEDKGQRDQTDLLLGLSWDNYWYYEEFPAFAAYTDDRRSDRIFTQEFRLVSDKDTSNWDWIAGLYLSDGEYEYSSVEYAPGLAGFFGDPSLGNVEANILVEQSITELALFGELGYQMTDKLHVLAGARAFTIDDKIDSCDQFPIAPPPFDEQSCDSGDGDGDHVLFKLSGSYEFTDDLLSYMLFSQGANLGFANIGRDLEPEAKYVDPEFVDNYELGLRSTFLDGALVVNGALFYMDWEDLHVDATSAAGFNIQRNAGGAKTQGLELESSWSIGEHWLAGLGYSYTKGELTEGCTLAESNDPAKNCPLIGEESSAGDRLPGAPEHQGSLLLGYRTAFSNGWSLRADYRLVSQSDVLTQLGTGDDCCRASGEVLPGFSTHHAIIGLSGERWDVSLYADNLTNKYAETGVRDTTDNIRSVGSYDVAIRRYSKFMITPRTVGLDLRYRFGD
jgi:iron complex outermembrane receptor protein